MASMHKCITTQIDSSLPDLFTSSRSPSHIELGRFEITVIAPLQWGHQILSSFGFSTYPHTSHMCAPLFLIHSSVVGHLGFFCNLAIVNSTAIKMGVQVPLE
jgi:hypothetical protein